jgi:hypothetical protein
MPSPLCESPASSRKFLPWPAPDQAASNCAPARLRIAGRGRPAGEGGCGLPVTGAPAGRWGGGPSAAGRAEACGPDCGCEHQDRTRTRCLIYPGPGRPVTWCARQHRTPPGSTTACSAARTTTRPTGPRRLNSSRSFLTSPQPPGQTVTSWSAWSATWPGRRASGRSSISAPGCRPRTTCTRWRSG